MDKAVSAHSHQLYWLDQLQDSDRDQVGEPFLQLSRLLQSGCPIRPGLLVPDAVMQEMWTQIRWSDRALQDFPYLRLNFSPDQALQLQQMAQTLQTGILELAVPKDWATAWEMELSLLEAKGSQLLLTPSIWTSQTDLATKSLQIPGLEPCLCDCHGAAMWSGLKQLWASLFQASNLFVFQYLGLRPESLHLSVLVQVLPSARLAGWAAVSPTHLQVQASTHLSFNPALATAWPELYCYERQSDNPQWQRVHSSSNPIEDLEKWSWKTIFRSLIELAPDFERLIGSAAVVWIILDQESLTLEFLGFRPDLPFPMPACAQVLALQGGLLGKGTAAAPGRLTAPAVVVKDFQALSPSALQGSILVTRAFEPVHLAWLQKAAGLLCETGGLLSHSAILARESGCPAVVGVDGITSKLRTGQWITLDGETGEVHASRPADVRKIDPPQSVFREEFSEQTRQEPSEAPSEEKTRVSATVTQVMVNLSQPELLSRLDGLAVDGIGIVRGEWLLGELLHQSSGDWLQGESRNRLKLKLRNSLKEMVESLAPRPVFYRAVDLYAAVWNRLDSKRWATDETNPALGLRGSLRYLTDARLLDLELEVLKSLVDGGITTLRLILPFVRSPKEVRYCAQKLQKIGLQDRLPLWIMAEVPSILLNLKAYRTAGAVGITVGLSDFTQLLLGTDRDLTALDSVRAQQQTVVQQAVAQLIQSATDLGLPSILCGALNPSREWLASLIAAGLTGITVDVGAVASVRKVVAQSEAHLRTRSQPAR